ncbi:ABC transporter ATP-binding protein [Lacrimispora aerotolerans]|uniref:ABC transporter ATP-binding protein n=1 Tax=Lacrimispora aerotolerans TaxID=36832 RepID=UPI00047C7453
MLTMENVQKQYDGYRLDCSLELRTGYITGLVGPNGAGKTTIFKSALGLISVDGGKIRILNKEPKDLTAKEREEIGVVLYDSGFSGYLTLSDISVFLKHLYKKFNKEEFEQKCRDAGLPFHKRIKEFSTGMKAKLKLIAAMSHQAKILILDEPTAGLDVIARDELLDYIRAYMQEGDRSILISSHISKDLETLCDDVYLLDQGRIVLHEETDVLLDRYGLLKATKEQYEELDHQHIIRRRKEAYGYYCLTDQKEYYTRNYPDLVMEKGTIDEILTLMIRGERI